MGAPADSMPVYCPGPAPPNTGHRTDAATCYECAAEDRTPVTVTTEQMDAGYWPDCRRCGDPAGQCLCCFRCRRIAGGDADDTTCKCPPFVSINWEDAPPERCWWVDCQWCGTYDARSFGDAQRIAGQHAACRQPAAEQPSVAEMGGAFKGGPDSVEWFRSQRAER